MDTKIPMKNDRIYTEQINTKVKPTLKEKYEFIKARGVDVGELSRSALEPAIEHAYEKMYGEFAS